jgi:hypothetical protein
MIEGSDEVRQGCDGLPGLKLVKCGGDLFMVVIRGGAAVDLC